VFTKRFDVWYFIHITIYIIYSQLGQFCDNIDVLQKAIVYIEEGKNSKTYIPLKKYPRKKLEEKG